MTDKGDKKLDVVNKSRYKIQIRRPIAGQGEEDNLWQEVRKFGKLVPYEPEPNMGRVQEIKEEIRKGVYLTPEVIEETAARMTIRFMKPE